MKKIRLALAKENKTEVQDLLKDFPLGESVETVGIENQTGNSGVQLFISVSGGQIISHPDWYNQSLPFLFPTLPLCRENLLGLLFYHLGLMDDAIRVSYGAEIHGVLSGLFQEEDLDWLDKWKSDAAYFHNLSILTYYHHLGGSSNHLMQLFSQAVENAPTCEMKAYSARHELVCLQEMGIPSDSERMEYLLSCSLQPAARNALQYELTREILTKAERTNAEVPVEQKEALQKLLNFYREQNAPLLVAELMKEMSWVASYENHYSEALSYLNQAIELYKEEEQEVLGAELFSKKAEILHQWAKSGMPHFYQQAIQAYQEALKVVKQDLYPYWFAEIHNRLGVLYAEMPEEQQKRSIWAAVSATSFVEALSFFTKEEYPYEYASVCHNYATALINYPQAIRNDNIEKALNYFNESLEIRTAEAYPQERTMTLLNFLEASWEASNINELIERVRLNDMREKTREIIALTEDPLMSERAYEHLNSIEKLQTEIADA